MFPEGGGVRVIEVGLRVQFKAYAIDPPQLMNHQVVHDPATKRRNTKYTPLLTSQPC